MSNRISYQVVDQDGLLKALERVSVMSLDSVLNKSLTQMRNRAVQNPGMPDAGGTPVDTRELIQSTGITKSNSSGGVSVAEFGYIKDYGPHVEFGHRTKGGGYVTGQFFLRNNLEIQTPILLDDALKSIERII